MKNIINLILAILIIMLATGCQVGTLQTNVNTYSNTNFGFSVNYPEGWKVSEDDYEEALGTAIRFYEEGKGEIDLMALMPFTTSENPFMKEMAFQSHEDFYDRAVISAWITHEGIKSLEVRDLSIEGLPAKEFIVTYQSTDEDGTIWKRDIVAFLDTRQGKAIPDCNAFRIIYGMPTDIFDNSCFKLIVDTFKFTK